MVGGGGHPGVSLVIQGGDTDGTGVWIGVMGAVVRDAEKSRDHPFGVPMPDNRESGDTTSWRFMGEIGRQGSDTYNGDTVDGHIHRPSAGNSSTVAGSMNTSGGMRTGNRI